MLLLLLLPPLLNVALLPQLLLLHVEQDVVCVRGDLLEEKNNKGTTAFLVHLERARARRTWWIIF